MIKLALVAQWSVNEFPAAVCRLFIRGHQIHRVPGNWLIKPRKAALFHAWLIAPSSESALILKAGRPASHPGAARAVPLAISPSLSRCVIRGESRRKIRSENAYPLIASPEEIRKKRHWTTQRRVVHGLIRGGHVSTAPSRSVSFFHKEIELSIYFV